MLAHADYFSPIQSTMLVYSDKFEFQNSGQFPIALTKKNSKVKSVPRNPNIIIFFRYARLAENAGYGIGKIMQWKELTGENVEIDSELSASTVTYWHLLGGQKSSQNTEEPHMTTREKLLKILTANPKATRAMLVEELQIAPSAIQRHINTLKTEGKIERIGAAKGGYWKINN